MASWRPPEGSWAPGGSHLAVKAARKRDLGGSWVRLGHSWWLLGRSGDLPGRSWWDAPGVHFGLPGVTFWSLLDLFLVSPCEIVKTSNFADSMALFEGFPGPVGSKIIRKSTPGASWAALGGPAGVHGAQVEVHGVQVGPK